MGKRERDRDGKEKEGGRERERGKGEDALPLKEVHAMENRVHAVEEVERFHILKRFAFLSLSPSLSLSLSLSLGHSHLAHHKVDVLTTTPISKEGVIRMCALISLC
jgi:hypothetical protein